MAPAGHIAIKRKQRVKQFIEGYGAKAVVLRDYCSRNRSGTLEHNVTILSLRRELLHMLQQGAGFHSLVVKALEQGVRESVILAHTVKNIIRDVRAVFSYRG